MWQFLKRLLGLGGQINSSVDPAFIDQLVDTASPRIKMADSYRQRLAPLVEHACSLVHVLGEKLPAPVALTAESWRNNRLLGVAFANPDRMAELVASDERIRQRMDHPRPRRIPHPVRIPLSTAQSVLESIGMGLPPCFRQLPTIASFHPTQQPLEIRRQPFARLEPFRVATQFRHPLGPGRFPIPRVSFPFILPRFTHHQPLSRQKIQMKYKLVLSNAMCSFSG